MDAVSVLEEDHRSLERLFREYQELPVRARGARQTVADQLCTELIVHTGLEEHLFYPAARLLCPALEHPVLESFEEHHVMAWTVAELAFLPPTDERFHPKATVLIDMVRRHVRHEEHRVFEIVRATVGPDVLHDLGRRLQDLRPHLAADPRPEGMDRPGATLSAAGGLIVEEAREAIAAAAGPADPRARPRARPAP